MVGDMRGIGRKAARLLSSITYQEELAAANGVPYNGPSRGVLKRSIRQWWRSVHFNMNKYEKRCSRGLPASRKPGLYAGDESRAKRWHHMARAASQPFVAEDFKWHKRNRRASDPAARTCGACRSNDDCADPTTF